MVFVDFSVLENAQIDVKFVEMGSEKLIKKYDQFGSQKST